MREELQDVSVSQSERRRFIRAHDAVGLHVQRLVETPAAGQAAIVEPIVSVRKFDKYAIEGYSDVRRDFPAVSEYICDLEERIRELLLDGKSGPTKPTHKVSLSVGGMSFADKSLFTPNEVVSLTITLFPSGQKIGTDAVIVSSNDEKSLRKNDEPTYRVKFVRMSDNDRLVIESHVQQLLTKRTLLED